MNTLPRFDTHEVFNQSPPYENIDLFSSDVPLQEAVRANGAGGEARRLAAFGRQWGTCGDVRARPPGQRELRRNSTPSIPRAFAATSSNFIRPITI